MAMKNKRLKILIAFIVLISITTKVEAMEVVSCGNLANVPYKPLEFIGNIIKLVQILVPVVLVIFGMIDMAKAMIAHDEKQQKDAQHIFIKRIIYAVLVYFVVAMVQFLFGLLGAGDSIMKCASCVVGGKCETTQLQVSKEEPGTTNNASNKDSPIGSVASRTTKVTSVKILSKKTELTEGKTFQIRANAYPLKAPQNLTYKSSNKKVATISSSGKIKAKSEGVTTITVQSQSNKSKKDTFKLKVKKKEGSSSTNNSSVPKLEQTESNLGSSGTIVKGKELSIYNQNTSTSSMCSTPCSSTVAKAGCSASSYSAAIYLLTNKKVKLVNVAHDLCSNGGYICGSGGKGGVIVSNKKLQEKYNVGGKSVVRSYDSFVKHLKKGRVILVSIKNGSQNDRNGQTGFNATKNGHYILLTDYKSSDGSIHVYNPNRGRNSGYRSKKDINKYVVQAVGTGAWYLEKK